MINNNKCKVSIILPLYNEPIIWIKECINSILTQTFQEFEIIVILDNPQNNEIRTYIENINFHNKKIKFFINEENLGLPKTLNRAIEYCKGDYIARMDADDICLERRLEKQYSYMINNPEIDLIGCNIKKIDESGKLIGENFSRPINHNYIEKFLKFGQPICHPTWFGKRDIFIKLRYNNLIGVEDMDFLCRVVLNNYKLANLPEQLLKYRVRASSISKNNSLRQLIYTQYISKEYAKSLYCKHKYSLKDIEQIEISEKKRNKYAFEEEQLIDLMTQIKRSKSVFLLLKFIILTFKSKYTILKIYRRICCEIIVLREKLSKKSYL